MSARHPRLRLTSLITVGLFAATAWSTVGCATRPAGPGPRSAPAVTDLTRGTESAGNAPGQPHGTWAALPPSPLPALAAATGVWDGEELLVTGVPVIGKGKGRAAAYRPSTGAWRLLPDPPVATTRWEAGPQAVWTGAEMIVLGAGYRAAYSPGVNTWRQLPAAEYAPLEGDFTMVWTGALVLTWGNCCGGGAKHGSYDPVSDAWTRLPAGPLNDRTAATAGWTGAELIVLGGSWPGGPLADAAAYRPTTRTWRQLPAMPISRHSATATWDGTELVVLGGGDGEGNGLADTQVAYRPGEDRWRILPSGLIPRQEHQAVWTGDELLVWGGGPLHASPASGTASAAAADGQSYDPTRNRWTALPKSPIRALATPVVAWTGTVLLVWGGGGQTPELPDGPGPAVNPGAVYSP